VTTPSGGSPIARLARAGVTQPIAVPVPSDDVRFLARKGTAKVAWRVARRRFEVWQSGQSGREAVRWHPAWRRAIWFHAEAPQLGDSLLDLAPRSLLVEHGIAVDVVLPAATLPAFRGDRWLGAVHGFADPIDARDHDVAIVDSACAKALAGKRRHAPALPWLSVRKDYLAYDYQRGLLATRRFAELLGLALSPADETRHARQKLEIGGGAVAAPDGRLALALGGVRPERSYRAWPTVARLLRKTGITRFTLLGSDNGSEAARAVVAALDDEADVLDLVARTDIAGTQRAMAAACAIVCVDGGLLHLACTTRTPTLAVFDASILPAWRLPTDFDGATLVSPTSDVNAIAPEAVTEAALRLMP